MSDIETVKQLAREIAFDCHNNLSLEEQANYVRNAGVLYAMVMAMCGSKIQEDGAKWIEECFDLLKQCCVLEYNQICGFKDKPTSH